MAQYHEPPEEIETIGRQLQASRSMPIKQIQRMLQEGESLIALCKKPFFKAALVLTNQPDLDEIRLQYSQGYIVRIWHYAVPTDKLKTLQ